MVQGIGEGIMRVIFAPLAFRDLQRIYDYLCKDDPLTAAEITDKIIKTCRTLKSFPNRGRSTGMHGRRELVLQSLPYIAVYRVSNDTVEISRIYHAAQNWP